MSGMSNASVARAAWAIREFARTLGISDSAANRLVRSGDVHTITVGARRLIPDAELQRIIQFGTGKPRKKP